MAKVNFKKPYMILPLIILPFIFIFYFLFFGMGDDEEKDLSAAEISTQGLNSDLPNASESIITPDRMEAYKEALRKRRQESGVKELEGPEQKRKLEDEEDARKMDSLKQAFAKSKLEKNKKQIAAENRERAIAAADDTRKALMKLRNKQNEAKNSTKKHQNRPQAPRNKKGRELEEFKKQMNYLDSLQNPEKYAVKEVPEEEKDPAFEISKTKTNVVNTQYFNTIMADRKKTLITAILDEGIKAWEGSRVRIRLLEPIFIDGRLLEKGQYLYGICSGFKAQRLLINVSSVVIDGEILPMDVSLYDNDGIEGIYIPDSSFRTFTKELGANSSQGQIRLEQSPNNNTQALYQSITRAVQSSSRAVQKALRKNKDRLKYNTQVFLVNNK